MPFSFECTIEHTLKYCTSLKNCIPPNEVQVPQLTTPLLWSYLIHPVTGFFFNSAQVKWETSNFTSQLPRSQRMEEWDTALLPQHQPHCLGSCFESQQLFWKPKFKELPSTVRRTSHPLCLVVLSSYERGCFWIWYLQLQSWDPKHITTDY